MCLLLDEQHRVAKPLCMLTAGSAKLQADDMLPERVYRRRVRFKVTSAVEARPARSDVTELPKFGYLME